MSGIRHRAAGTAVPAEPEDIYIYGRGERIRTSDSCVPNAVLYQAELHPVLHSFINLLMTLLAI